MPRKKKLKERGPINLHVLTEEITQRREKGEWSAGGGSVETRRGEQRDSEMCFNDFIFTFTRKGSDRKVTTSSGAFISKVITPGFGLEEERGCREVREQRKEWKQGDRGRKEARKGRGHETIIKRWRSKKEKSQRIRKQVKELKDE